MRNVPPGIRRLYGLRSFDHPFHQAVAVKYRPRDTSYDITSAWVEGTVFLHGDHDPCSDHRQDNGALDILSQGLEGALVYLYDVHSKYALSM